MAFTEKKRTLFLGLPWTFTTYTVSEELVTMNSGFFKKVENDCYMYKILDVRLETSILERVFGLGTVHCFGGDVTHPDMVLSHIKNAKEIKDYILRNSEEQRIKRKTLNTQDIGGRLDLEDLAEDSCLY